MASCPSDGTMRQSIIAKNHQVEYIMKSIAITGLSGLASATPILVARDTFCGQWDSEVSGPYTIFNNLWGQDNADEGEQCTTNNGLSADDKLSWSVEWTWVGGESSVKSYPNVVVESDPAPLSDVSSIQAEWAWT